MKAVLVGAPCYSTHVTVRTGIFEVNIFCNLPAVCILAFLRSFLGKFAKLRKATVSFVMSVCLSVRMEQLASYWTDFHEI